MDEYIAICLAIMLTGILTVLGTCSALVLIIMEVC